jgi:hypothetical protein
MKQIYRIPGSVRLWALASAMMLVFFAPKLEGAQNGTAPNLLPGLQTGSAPWLPEIDNLRARLKAINLPALYAEGNALHIHQHLDVLVNGKPITVPAGIGINEVERFISPLHTHDASGIIHVESDVVRDFTLGEFFDVWGLRLSQSCLGGYCAGGTQALRVFVDGKPVAGDPRKLVLREHQEIAVVYGARNDKTAVPSTYDFEF